MASETNTNTLDNSIKLGMVLCKNSDGSELLATRWSKISSISIENWYLNRPPDNARIPEIIQQLKNQDYVDGVVYLANNNGSIICYDGIHRIESLKLLSHDIECNIDHKLFVHYYPSYNEQIIKQKFETLNKCVPVPEIYTSAHKELDVKQNVEEIVRYYTEKYPSMFKPSKKPNIPHENRDAFTDKVYHIIHELQLTQFNYNKILDAFTQFNVLMNEKKRFLKLSVKQLKKCHETNCYIFTRKDWDRVFIISYYNDHIKLNRH
jgi:hypothetical protein